MYSSSDNLRGTVYSVRLRVFLFLLFWHANFGWILVRIRDSGRCLLIRLIIELASLRKQPSHIGQIQIPLNLMWGACLRRLRRSHLFFKSIYIYYCTTSRIFRKILIFTVGFLKFVSWLAPKTSKFFSVNILIRTRTPSVYIIKTEPRKTAKKNLIHNLNI